MKGAAVYSEDQQHRYQLLRSWTGPQDPEPRRVLFIMLNPSTATATTDDPTIRRCIGFAATLGYHALTVVNLFALRATDPRELFSHPDPVGARNDACLAGAIAQAAQDHTPAIAAWGAVPAPSKDERVSTVLGMPGAARLSVLGLTKAGHPRHPLYLPRSARPVPWMGQ